MSYLVLARKWRPQNFKDVVGQKPIVRILQNALQRNRVAHAMIFSGVRGVGKTTLARIMAKALNCAGATEEPCNTCKSCLSIMNGNALDLHEIDGASNRGIQEIRDLKENLRFLPSEGKYKIIIIDEVHMLTTEAFNALLKTLEEPPEHVYFMFATTELHKVPITILSRCQRYELKRISFNELVDFFKHIADKEDVSISEMALHIIAGQADGSVRDGLSLLDQIFSFCGDKVTEKDLSEVLGIVDRKIFASLAAFLLAGDLGNCLQLLNSSFNQGLDLKRFSHDLLYFFRSLLVFSASSNPSEILDISDQEMASLEEISKQHSTETISNIFNLLLKSIEEMQYSSQPRMVLEMAFIKAASTKNIVPVSDILSRLDNLIDGGFSDIEENSLTNPQDNNEERKKKIHPQILDYPEEQPDAAEEIDIEPPIEDKLESESLPVPAEEESQSIENFVKPISKDIIKDWDGFLGHVKERKTWMASTLGLCEKASEKNGELTIKFDEPSECLYLQETANIKLLTEFAQDFFQKELTVKITVRGRDTGDKHELDKPQEERRALANDPRVQLVMEVIGGQVTGIRTGPRSR